MGMNQTTLTSGCPTQQAGPLMASVAYTGCKNHVTQELNANEPAE